MSVIVFSHPKGGTGKSTLAHNYLAHTNSKRKSNVVFVDLDTQKSVTTLNELRKISDGKYLPYNIANVTTDDELIVYIEDNRDNVDIVIDTGGYDAVINRTAIAMADLIIVPVGFSPLETNRLYDFLKDIVADMEYDLGYKLPIYVVFNRLHTSVKNVDEIRERFDEFNVKFFKTIVHQRAIIEYSLADGGSVAERGDDEKGVKTMKEFFSEIKEILKELEQ